MHTFLHHKNQQFQQGCVDLLYPLHIHVSMISWMNREEAKSKICQEWTIFYRVQVAWFWWYLILLLIHTLRELCPTALPVHSTCASSGRVYRLLWSSIYCLPWAHDAAQQCCLPVSHQRRHRQYSSLREEVWWQRGAFLLPFPIYCRGVSVRGREPATCP